ncbi:M67 family metallopeptidase [Salinisphaera sp.]|uniref:M67 family metallopeptidase n=1 Tax=Salinisphaera sp. TaxID=1914330 RepID=UPI002D777EB0|nr:M67 family metallopeptidase [Salinisphaera sp.]HET7315439.1 M67 family metallopeptidase [Salinisphaera sp.]
MVATRLTLPHALGAALVDEARDAGGFEICGFIAAAAGGDNKPIVRYPIANRAARAADRFDMDAAEQVAAFKRMRERGETLIAIYHSHPIGEAEPSTHDRRGHSYPDAAAVIAAPNARAAPIRAWRMTAAAPKEIAIAWAGAPEV